MNTVGIDLSQTRCALVEVSSRSRGREAAGGEGTRVLAFDVIPAGGGARGPLASELRALLARRAVSRRCRVALWGVRSSHRLMLLPAGKRADLEAGARHEAKRGGPDSAIDPADLTVGVTPGSTREPAGGTSRREAEVSVVAVSSSDVRERLRPILDAGFTVEGVTTPCVALCSLARRRRGGVPGAADAYAAVMPHAVALAIVRDGLLVFGREIAWGYQGEHGKDYRAPLGAEELAERLSSELRRSFLFFKQHARQDVAQVLLCGALPGLRSLTAPLIERLDLDVETLDSLEGIDAAALPEPAERFREQIADLRLAWALSADPSPSVNLLPPGLAARSEAGLRRRLFGAGMAAALAASAVMYGYAGSQARTAERLAQDLERQVSALEPRPRETRAERDGAALESARLAALVALETQGPRLARVLEALARLQPEEVTLRSLRVSPEGASWRLSIAGLVRSADAARGRETAGTFIRGLQDSFQAGAPVRLPLLRLAAGEEPAAGIEFAADFSIRR